MSDDVKWLETVQKCTEHRWKNVSNDSPVMFRKKQVCQLCEAYRMEDVSGCTHVAWYFKAAINLELPDQVRCRRCDIELYPVAKPKPIEPNIERAPARHPYEVVSESGCSSTVWAVGPESAAEEYAKGFNHPQFVVDVRRSGTTYWNRVAVNYMSSIEIVTKISTPESLRDHSHRYGSRSPDGMCR